MYCVHCFDLSAFSLYFNVNIMEFYKIYPMHVVGNSFPVAIYLGVDPVYLSAVLQCPIITISPATVSHPLRVSTHFYPGCITASKAGLLIQVL